MESILTNYLTQIIAWLESGAGFIQKEMPLYIEELIRYKTIHLSISFIGSMVIIICSIILIVVGFMKDEDDMGPWFGVAILGIILVIIFSCIGLYYFDPFLRIHIAPRVYLIDYLKTIIQ